MLNRTATIFDDLEDQSIFTGAARAETRAAETAAEVEKTATLGNWESCPKCRGTGNYRHFGQCFTCNGRGGKYYKTTKSERVAAKAQRQGRENHKRDDRLEAFKGTNPAEYAWLEEAARSDHPGRQGFAASLIVGVQKYGNLTDNQLAAVRKNIAARAEAVEAKKTREAAAPVISVERIEQAFATAAGNGLKKLKLRLGTFVFSPAKENSRNPGAIYVKDGSEYLGKVVAGKFLCVGSCGDERRDAVLAAAADPEAAATAHGKQTGQCSCCDRELTDPESIARGIGPVCAENYGW